MKRKTKFKRIHELEAVLASQTHKKVTKSGAGLIAAIAKPAEGPDCVNLARYIHNAKYEESDK